MLILVGVTVTVAINGGLFSSAKEGAKGTTIARVKEQITSDIATKIAERDGEKITKRNLKDILVPQYGILDESGENLILKDGNYTIPLTEIWNDFYEFKLNDHDYYENCIYGTKVYDRIKEYLTEEERKELDNYVPDFETELYYGTGVVGMTEREEVTEWYGGEEYFEENGFAMFGYFKGTDFYSYLVSKKNGSVVVNRGWLKYEKDNVKGVIYFMDRYHRKCPSFFENEGKEFYLTMWGS